MGACCAKHDTLTEVNKCDQQIVSTLKTAPLGFAKATMPLTNIVNSIIVYPNWHGVADKLTHL